MSLINPRRYVFLHKNELVIYFFVKYIMGCVCIPMRAVLFVFGSLHFLPEGVYVLVLVLESEQPLLFAIGGGIRERGGRGGGLT